MTDHYLNGIIDRFEDETAVIVFTNGQQLLWPKAKLPANATEGAALTLRLEAAPAPEKTAEQTAKNLLNDILQN